MVLLDDVLSQLRDWQSQNKINTAFNNDKKENILDKNPIILMLRILFSIESIPLKSVEMRAIFSDIDKCLTSLYDAPSLQDCSRYIVTLRNIFYANNLLEICISADVKLIKSLLDCRSSFSFMPSITRYMDSTNLQPINNELSPVVAAELDILLSFNKKSSNIFGRTFISEETKDAKGELSHGSILPISVQVSAVENEVHRPQPELPILVSKREDTSSKDEKLLISSSSPNEYLNSKKYFVCNIIRHQSTLWTSYRLYLDHVMDLNSSGELLRDSANTVYFSNNTSSLNESYSSNENDETQQHSKASEHQQSSRGLFLLGAKKLTTVSISSQWHIWDSNVSATADSKFW